ncbi:uncharacterized protein LOC129945053 [Eupeodes corollae]|uniref:uncharacterized protein LOC129945053 n=1 Tax=Eupeodes corollae TaxID=290404 RepID=UPI0024910E73|nr:uncharacterized protein LOC129945053 [Eupeodes corollae]
METWTEKTTPEGKVKTPEGEEQTSHEVLTLMRRQKALMNSLSRLIDGRVKEEVPIQCLEAMNKLWSQIEELHYSIWEKCENPLTEGYDMNSYSEFEIKILKNRSSLKGPTNNTRNDHLSVQLPKMTIPKFDGDYLKWQTFSVIFTKMIHHQDLPQIQKMWYLKTNVSGDAERLLRHLELTEENYTIAWQTLQDRFSNKRAQTLSLIQKILGLPQQNSEVKTMREFHDTIHESLAALKALSIDTDSWAPLLIYLLTKKLDRQSHLLYEQSVKNPRELPTIEEFLKFLKSRFEALEAVGEKTEPRWYPTLLPPTSITARYVAIRTTQFFIAKSS